MTKTQIARIAEKYEILAKHPMSEEDKEALYEATLYRGAYGVYNVVYRLTEEREHELEAVVVSPGGHAPYNFFAQVQARAVKSMYSAKQLREATPLEYTRMLQSALAALVIERVECMYYVDEVIGGDTAYLVDEDTGATKCPLSDFGEKLPMPYRDSILREGIEY